MVRKLIVIFDQPKVLQVFLIDGKEFGLRECFIAEGLTLDLLPDLTR